MMKPCHPVIIAFGLLATALLAGDTADTSDDEAFTIRDFVWTVASIDGAKFQIERQGKYTNALIVASGTGGGMQVAPKVAEAIGEALALADKSTGRNVVKLDKINVQIVFRDADVTIGSADTFTENAVVLTRPQAVGLAKVMRRAVKAAAFAETVGGGSRLPTRSPLPGLPQNRVRSRNPAPLVVSLQLPGSRPSLGFPERQFLGLTEGDSLPFLVEQPGRLTLNPLDLPALGSGAASLQASLGEWLEVFANAAE